MVVVAALFLPALISGFVVRTIARRILPPESRVAHLLDEHWPWISLVLVAAALAAVSWTVAIVVIAAFAVGWRHRHQLVWTGSRAYRR